MGRDWVHAARAADSRFLIDLLRTREAAAAILATFAAFCLGTRPRLLVDGHLPYPAANLEVFGVVKHG